MTTHPLDIALLVLFLAAGVWAVMTLNLLRSAIGLAAASLLLAILLFRMNAPIAGVFELSVCAGLITSLFISIISLTKPLTGVAAVARDRSRLLRFALLPILLLAVTAILLTRRYAFDFPLPAATPDDDFHQVLWDKRRFDLLGQILMVLGGTFGVVVLFKIRGRAQAENRK